MHASSPPGDAGRRGPERQEACLGKQTRKARLTGTAQKQKDRPLSRITWLDKPRHPELDYYGPAVKRRMEELNMTERDLASASTISRSCVNRIINGKITTSLENDKRLHTALCLPDGALMKLAAELMKADLNPEL